jgi:hypothetical protein
MSTILLVLVIALVSSGAVFVILRWLGAFAPPAPLDSDEKPKELS